MFYMSKRFPDKKKIAMLLILLMLFQCILQPSIISSTRNITYADTTGDIQAPSAPTNLMVKTVSGSAITIEWSPSTDNMGVELYSVYCNGNNIGSTENTSYTYTGLQEEITYSIFVIAYDEAGNASEQSNTVTAMLPANQDTEAPSIPANLAITAVTGSSIALAWDASTDNEGIDYYEIYCNNISLGTTQNTYFIYTEFTGLITCNFYIIAHDEAGNISMQSNTATVPVSNISDTLPPSAPTNLIITSITGSAISLSWDISVDNIKIKEYGIYCNEYKVGTTADTSFIYNNANEGMLYSFYIIAYDEAGNASMSSNIQTVTNPITDIVAPTAPSNLRTLSVTGSSIVLNWNASLDNIGVKDYEVFINGYSMGKTSNIHYTCPETFEEAFECYVIAYDEAGNASAPSNTITINIPEDDIAPTTPMNLVATVVSGDAITLSWDAAEDNVGVLGYNVYINGNKVGSTANTFYTCSELNQGNTYNFYVIAYDKKGNMSEQSNTVTKIIDYSISLVNTDTTDTSVGLSWTVSENVLGIAYYKVFRDNRLIGETTEFSYTDTELLQGTLYKFSIKAYDINNILLGTSNQIQVLTIDTEAPTAPANLRLISVTSTTATIEWDASTDNVGVVNYYVYGTNNPVVVSSDITRVTLTGLYPSTTYDYVVVLAEDIIGNIAESNKIEITTSADIPGNLKVSQGASGLLVTWNESFHDYNNYQLSINGDIIDIASPHYFDPPNLSYNQTNVLLNQIYEYRIRTRTSIDLSEWSEPVIVYTGYVTDFNVREINTNEARLTWESVEGANAYEVEINGLSIGEISGNSYLCDNLEAKNNVFRVRPVKGELKGLWNTYTIWDDIASPYIIQGFCWLGTSFEVSMWSTLQIKSGVEVEFSYGNRMTVYGKLIAQGTLEAPIKFGCLSGDHQWLGIKVDGTGKFIGEYVTVKNAVDYYTQSYAAFDVQGMGSLMLNHSVIEIQANGIYIKSENDICIENTLIYGDGNIGILIDKQNITLGTVSVKNCTLNGRFCYCIDIDEAGSSGVLIENNIFNNESGDAITVNEHVTGDFLIRGNTFAGYNTAVRINLEKISLLTLINNIIDNDMKAEIDDYIRLVGELVVDYNFTLPENKYSVDNIRILGGNTLQIQPGTVLMLNGDIYVEGKLSAIGQIDKPIIITNGNYYGGWGGLYIDGTGELEANYLNIKNGYNYNLYVEGSLKMLNSMIENSNSGIVFSTSIQPTLRYITFRGNSIAATNLNENMVIDASHNYWNSIYGPSIEINTYNPVHKVWYREWSGNGAKIVGNILYAPYLGDEITAALQFGKEQGVYAPTGNYSNQASDLEVECLNDSINFVRSYDSQNTNETSVLGKGWSFNYDSYITDNQTYGNIKIVKLPDGSSELFTVNTDGTFTANNSRNTLIRNADGTYILTDKYQKVYAYNSDGKLSWIENKQGNRLTIIYSINGKDSVKIFV